MLAAVAPRDVADAVHRTSAQRVYVCNLRPQDPETAGFDVAAHVQALIEHGVEVDVALCDTSREALPSGDVDDRWSTPTLAGHSRLVRDPLANWPAVLADLLG